MKIKVKGDGHNISIPVPTRLIFNKASVWMYLKLARTYSSRAKQYIPADVEITVDEILEKLPDEAVYALCAEIIRIKKKHGSWELVNVKSANGDEVQIFL